MGVLPCHGGSATSGPFDWALWAECKYEVIFLPSRDSNGDVQATSELRDLNQEARLYGKVYFAWDQRDLGFH